MIKTKGMTVEDRKYAFSCVYDPDIERWKLFDDGEPTAITIKMKERANGDVKYKLYAGRRYIGQFDFLKLCVAQGIFHAVSYQIGTIPF